MTRTLTSRLPMLAWVTVVWLALWGDLSWANVLGGLAVGTALLLVVPLPRPERMPRVSPVAAARYFLRFLRDLTVATAEVARQVFWPVERLRPAIVAVHLTTRRAGLLSLVANTITLTPGTMTLEVDEGAGVLFVHCLHLPEGREGDVEEQARELEALGARALGIEEER